MKLHCEICREPIYGPIIDGTANELIVLEQTLEGDVCPECLVDLNAFDQGVKDGEEQGDQADNPFASDKPFLHEAWATGHSVGCLNRIYLLKKEAELANGFKQMNIEEVPLGPGPLRFFQVTDLADPEVGLAETHKL